MKSKKILIAAIIVTLLIAIFLTVWVIQQQTKTRSKANAATSLSLNPSSLLLAPGQSGTATIVLDPGTNQVNRAKLVISFNSSIIDKNSITIAPTAKPTDAGLNTILSPFTMGSCSNNICHASIDLGIGTNALNALTAITNIATITVRTLPAATGNALISFDTTPVSGTIINSLGPSDFASENVLSVANPLSITVQTAPSPTPSLTPAPGATDTPTQTPNATVTPTLPITPTPPAGATDTPIPTGGACPVPGKVQNVRISCPFCL